MLCLYLVKGHGKLKLNLDWKGYRLVCSRQLQGIYKLESESLTEAPYSLQMLYI